MKGSVYMRWAKDHAAARYNLANSGILGVESLDLEPGDVLVNGPNRDGYRPLLEAIAARYGVTPERVVQSEGTSGANFLAFAALLDPGDEVLVEEPTYEPLLAALSFVGARIRRFSRRFEDGYHLDLDGLRKAMSDRVRMVVITNPHNPSGVFLPAEEMAEAVRIAESAHVLIDEVYQDVVTSGSHVRLGPNVLATSSLTKCYGLNGLRCGWALGSPEVAKRLRHAKDFMGSVGSIASDGLAVAAFRQIGRLEARTREILDPNVRMIHEFLREHEDLLECVVPPRAMKVFPRLRKEEDSERLHDRLRQLETSIVPGRFFENPRHFRLGFAVLPADVEEGLRRLSVALRAPL